MIRYIVQTKVGFPIPLKWKNVYPFDHINGGLDAAIQQLNTYRKARPSKEWRLVEEEVTTNVKVLNY